MMSSDLSSVKIIDFGYATPLDPAELAQSSRFLRGKLSCTANYMAPELYSSNIKTSLANADVFALGVILINFLTGEYTFDSVFEGKTEQVNQRYLAFMESPQEYLGSYGDDRELIDLIKGMLQFKSDDRYSIEQILNHQWVKKAPIAAPEEA